ncbi:MAG: hypothetical protein AUI16_17910 [Alphaproteobacteria bacterium 13_2_20CM_2_64_7]|nr:MAG: hypothetical protein AUI16_17910 [Alphaproteobacteria bacterium 13_2_20CM_2_64_7]
MPYHIICHADDARTNFAFALAEIPIEQPTKRDNHDSCSFILFALAAFAAIDVRPSVPESYKPCASGILGWARLARAWRSLPRGLKTVSV